MNDEWTVAERSLGKVRYLTQGDCDKTQKPGPQKVRKFLQLIRGNSRFRVRRLWILRQEQLEGKHSLTKNIFWFLRPEINVVLLFSIVILHRILCRLG
jgi:hypothetical protein